MSARHAAKHMAGSAKRGPSPVLVLFIVLIVALVAGGAALWVFRPQLLDNLPFDLPFAEVTAKGPEKTDGNTGDVPEASAEAAVPPEANPGDAEAAQPVPQATDPVTTPAQEVPNPTEPVAPETAPTEPVVPDTMPAEPTTLESAPPEAAPEQNPSVPPPVEEQVSEQVVNDPAPSSSGAVETPKVTRNQHS